MSLRLSVLEGAAPPSRREPWFRQWPAVTVAVAGVLFAGIFGLRQAVGDATDAFTMLYTLPVGLLATAFGRRAGAAAGILAVGLIVVWVLLDDIDVSPAGWASRVTPVLLLGVLVGDASDRLRRAESERRRHEAASLLHREAIEVNDRILQGMAATKWALEAGSVDRATQLLSTSISEAQTLVSELIRKADMGDHSEDLGPDRRPRP